MGVRHVRNANLTEELDRVKRHIDLAVFELTEARSRMTAAGAARSKGLPSSQGDLATVCISLELALADCVAWAQKLAEKVSGEAESAESAASRN